MTLCTTRDIFHASCLDDMNGGKTERDNACLLNGIDDTKGGHSSCRSRTDVIATCKQNPFAHNGCKDTDGISFVITVYCRGSNINGIPDGSATPECRVNYDNWEGGFTDTLTTTTPTGTNKFLPNISLTPTGDEERRSLNLNTATFDGRPLGGDVNSGVVFYRTGANENTSHFAGILADTDLGRPIETRNITGQWNGSFWATNMDTATDFTLHIDFNSRDIAGIVRNGATDNYYFVKGVYDDGGNSGLITGTVRYGTFTSTEINFNRSPKRFPTSASTSGGVLRGIIGQDSAVGVFISGNTLVDDDTQTTTSAQFGWAGGFVVNPTAQVNPNVNYNDWMRGFGVVAPPAMPATATRLNQFLNAGADRLATANGGNAPPALDFDDIYGENKIDSDSNNGVAWFSVEDSPDRYHYAGIFETTDLGVPLTGETATKAMWSGQFQATGMASAVAFDLEITFGDAGVGEIAAFIPSGDDHYLLTGNYTASGLIRGEVNFGEFTNDLRTTPADTAATRKGVLSGLIGSNGAVGAFISGTTTDNGQTIAGGTGATGYAGGFVASPFVGEVSYRDWVSDASPTPVDSHIPASSGGNNLNQFLTTSGNGLNGKIADTLVFNLNMGSLNGDPNDGFSVQRFISNSYFAGISSTTSLGVALPYRQMFNEKADAMWDGRFVIYEERQVVTIHEFKLIVDFVNSDISTADDVAGYSFTDVGFSDKGVVSQGTITRTSETAPLSLTGTLQGLIGSNGAVGVFHSDASNIAFSYAGGFVAAFKDAEEEEEDDILPLPTYANFKNYYGNAMAREDERTLYPLPKGIDSTRAFVEGTKTGLVEGDLFFTDTVSGNFAPVAIKLGGLKEGDEGFDDIDDGFALMFGHLVTSVNQRIRAGLLSGTNLGAALDNTVTANWSGSVHIGGTSGIQRYNLPTVTVNFDAGTIISAPESFNFNTLTIQIDGRFGAGLAEGTPAGILGGNFIFNSSNVPLIGLIGKKGALGVFATNASPFVSGGFEACPDALRATKCKP